MDTGSKDVELFSFETLRQKDHNQAASVPKEQRKQDPCSGSNGKRQHPWHQCVIGRRVTAVVRDVTEQVQKEAECREFMRELIVSFYPKSPRILRNHHSRIWMLLHCWALWTLLLVWTHLYSQLVRPQEADLCLQRAPGNGDDRVIHVKR